MIKNQKLESFLVGKDNVYFGNKINAQYLAQFKSSNLHVFYINKVFYAITDSRYLLAAKKNIKDMVVLNISDQNTWVTLINQIKKSDDKKLYIDGSITTINRLEQLKLIFKNITIKSLEDFESLRLIKTPKEIELIKQASLQTDLIFEKLRTFIKVGMSEKEVKSFLDTQIITSVANRESFPSIVASGPNSSNPHWESGDRKIQDGDAIIIDMGQFFENYTSDVTRTFFVGKPTQKQLEVYEIVLQAQKLGIEAIKPGVEVKEIDKIVRDYITEKGYGSDFNHSTGHGIGYDIHEAPNVSQGANDILEEGMVITIEPGIYLKDKFGIRIEDDILVTKNGFENLTKFTKDIITINNN